MEEPEVIKKGSQFLPRNDPRWLKICDYTGWNPYGRLRPIKYKNFVMPFSKSLNYTPRFYNELRNRINNIQPIRMMVVGEAGSGKSYTAMTIGMILDKKFCIEQVVFKYKDFMDLSGTLKSGQPIVLEEPAYILGARTWFNEFQRVIVSTIESSRYLNNPLIICVVNRNLIDKTIREYYCNYCVEMRRRGVARVYRTWRPQWYDKPYRKTAIDIFLPYPGVDLAECDRTTCLECKELPTCNKYIWPKYERKRAETIAYYRDKGKE